MGDGVRLAIAIAFVFAAGIAFFFAFHPYGVGGGSVDNADSALGWLMQEYQLASGDDTGPSNAGATGSSSSSADQYIGQPEHPYVPPQTKDVGPNG